MRFAVDEMNKVYISRVASVRDPAILR